MFTPSIDSSCTAFWFINTRIEAECQMLGDLQMQQSKRMEKTKSDAGIPACSSGKQQTGMSASPSAILEDLIDACVLESYFPEEAQAKNLRFIDPTLSLLSGKIPDIQSFPQTVNAPTHPIRNQLFRLTADNPELFALIKEEGRE